MIRRPRHFISFPPQGYLITLGLLVLSGQTGWSQKGYLSRLHAGKNFPIYTGYAAARERSHFLLDEGYRFNYDQDSLGADFLSGKAGSLGLAFRTGGKIIYRTLDYFRPPLITDSYPDLVRYEFMPVKGLLVRAFFLVYSSDASVWQLRIKNISGRRISCGIYLFVHGRPGLLKDPKGEAGSPALSFGHQEPPDSWSQDHQIPYPDRIRDLLLLSENPDSILSGGGKPPDGSLLSFRAFPRGEPDFPPDTGGTILLGFCREITLARGSSKTLRLVRAVAAAPARPGAGQETVLLRIPLEPFLEADQRMMGHIPDPHLKDPAQTALYWSACNMMRQVFYPPEGKCREDYYVFSRVPMWGWGHGGQVFHESLSMLEYVRIDPSGAEGSQEVYADRQQPDGYINYRTGPYLDETIPANGSLTSSAPWYNWENWEIYRQTRDQAFLRRMYDSGEKFFRWFVSHRDSDRDGLCEWGGDPVLESVRDGDVAVWDQVGPPSAFNSPDLNCMLVREARSLEQMALALGRKEEAASWKQDYERRISLINRYCWDSVKGFYYNVTLGTHQFSYRKENDLKRDEIIGFLPLWAGVASPVQARRLVEKLTDTSAFWRPYGIPSLSASDSDYNPRGYWNGPAWVQWNYLVERGLLNYGYRKTAREIASRVSQGMIAVLRRTHELWEFYSPDSAWGGLHRTYIWAGLINRMMTDAQSHPPVVN